MFDYKGFTEKELVHLCGENNVQSYMGKFPIPFWTTELYGFGKWLRKYAFYPRKYPIYLYSDHSGPSFTNEIFEYDFQFSNAFAMLFHTPEVVRKWNGKYKPKAHVLYSPFVFCRKSLGINVKQDAKGTLAYPSHSLPDIDDVSDIVKYIEDLKKLPAEFQPVAVSLHYHDIVKGRHRIFLNEGIPVYTAGTPHDYRFTERFYSILSNFKYATSNFLGSYIFYAVEMDIPFFFYGDAPLYKVVKENANSDFDIKAIAKSANSSNHIYDLFGNVSQEISETQRKFVNTQLGVNDGIGRVKMAILLYCGLLEVEIKKIARKIQHRIQRWVATT